MGRVRRGSGRRNPQERRLGELRQALRCAGRARLVAAIGCVGPDLAPGLGPGRARARDPKVRPVRGRKRRAIDLWRLCRHQRRLATERARRAQRRGHRSRARCDPHGEPPAWDRRHRPGPSRATSAPLPPCSTATPATPLRSAGARLLSRTAGTWTRAYTLEPATLGDSALDAVSRASRASCRTSTRTTAARCDARLPRPRRGKRGGSRAVPQDRGGPPRAARVTP